MIHRALLKVFGCSGAGALSGGIMIYLFVWSEWVEWGVESAQPFRLDWHEKEMVFLFAVVGTLVGMIGGIGWAIEHNEARWHSLVVHDPTNRNGRGDSNGIGKCGRVCAAQG